MLECPRTLSLVSSIYTYFLGDVIQSYNLKFQVYKTPKFIYPYRLQSQIPDLCIQMLTQHLHLDV